ncbi:MAG: glutathione S-transferase family protein [Rhodospirillales bacterium]|nr:glutathione S-transferase family protein [Rhodospirillales bacterium]
MALKIYGVLRSRATRPIWMAKELGIPFEHVPVIQVYRLANPDAPDAPLHTRSPAFLAVNPNGLVPCIDDDGLVLNESFAITFYLARKHGGPLAPRDVREEALMLQWTLWAATEVEMPALRAMQNAAAVKTRDAAIYDASVAALGPKLAVLDKALAAGGGHLVGGRFTVADLNVAEVVRYAQGAPELFTDLAHVRSWIDACQARPAFREMMEARNAEPA